MDSEGNYIFEYLQNKATLYGGEIGVHFHPHPFDWLHFESSFESVTAKRYDGEYLPLIPSNRVNSSIKTDIKNKKWLENAFFSLNISTNLAQNNVSAFETKTKDYTLLNIAVSGKVKLSKINFEANLNFNNLLNKNYISHLSRLKNDNIPNIGRNIIFGVFFNL
jgi:iron complex outermembrane recepter protein